MNKSSFNTQQMENPAPVTIYGIPTVPRACPDFGLGKDPSSRLSELQMALKQPYARYRDLPDKIDGVNWLFSIEASVHQFCAVGIGYTKKEAKRRASTALLQKMGYEVPEKDLLDATQTPVNSSLQNMSKNAAPSASRDKASVHIGPDFGLGKDPSSRLSELQMLRNEKYAVYRTVQEKMVNNICVFTIEASLNQFTATGSAFTKKEAKRRASTALLFKMGFTVPKEDQPMENGLQKQVTPPEKAAVMEKATERYSREEQNLIGATGDSETNSESAESLVEIIIPQDAKILEKTQLPEDPSEQEGLDEVTEITEAEEILPDQSVENITGTSRDTQIGLEIQNPVEPPFPKDTTSDGHQILEEMLAIALTSPLWAPTLEDETAEKPTEIKTPEGPGDDTDEALTAEETLGDSLMDAECAADAQSPLLWSNSDFETSSTSEDHHSNCADKLPFDGISKISQSPLLWSEFCSLDSRINTFLRLMEVPEGESVEEISEASADSSSEGPQSPSETQSPEQGGILDESINSESAESLVETLIPEDLEILEETRLPEDPTEQEGLKEITEITEAGVILPDQAVENITGTSGDTQIGLEIRNPVEPPFPKDTTSDGHQILEEMLAIALTSPLWALTLEDETAQKPTEIKTPEGPGDDTDEALTAEETLGDSLMDAECAADAQSPLLWSNSDFETSSTSEDLHSNCADKLPFDGISQISQSPLLWSEFRSLESRINTFLRLMEVPEGESVEEISEASADSLDESINSESAEAGVILPNQAVENIFVTSGIYNPCPKDTPSDGHQILEEMLNLAITSPLWAETLEDEDEDHRTEELDSEICEASRTYDSAENISEESYQSAKEHTCPGEICSEGHQSPSETQSPEQGVILDQSINSESAESLVETLIPEDPEILEETRLPEDPTEQEGLKKATEITEAGEILPDQAVENITGTSGDTQIGLEIRNPVEPPFPKDTTSDGHQILEEMLAIALTSPLWALTLEDETAQKPTEIKTPEGPGDDTDEALTAEETLGDSLMDAECAADAQSPLLWSNSDFETSSTSEDLHSNCADKLPFDRISKISQSPLLWSEFRSLESRINTFLRLMEVPEGESVEEISEASADSLDESINSESADAGVILPNQAVENFFVTSGIYNPCPKDTPSDGHQILEEMLNLAITSPLWAETLEDEDEDHRTEELDSEIPEASRTYDSAENISEESYQSAEEHTCPGEICSEGHQSPSETQSPEQGGILDQSINSESAESLVETLIPEDPEILEETRLPEDPTEHEGLKKATEITEAGEILPDQAVENFFVTSAIYNPCPKDTPSDGHQILEEMMNLAITSSLWTETLEDEDEDHRTEEQHIDSEIPEASRTYDSAENISEASHQSPEEHTCPGETCSEGHQNHDQSHDPEPANSVETKVVDGPREEEHSAVKLLAVPESTEDFETVPERTTENFVIWVMMKKLFKSELAHLSSYRDTLVDLLEKAALDHFVIPEGVRIKSKDIHKLGKAAARDLMHEYGGSFKVLLAAMETNTMEFQEDAIKHLNIRLSAYKNRPKSRLMRLFSKWDKPYYY